MARGVRPGIWDFVSLTAGKLEMPPNTKAFQALCLFLLLLGHLGPQPSPFPTQEAICLAWVGCLAVERTWGFREGSSRCRTRQAHLG